MTLPSEDLIRLTFFVRVVRKEIAHLSTTDGRLFGEAFTAARAVLLAGDPDLAERVEAFVVRFARLQDTVGDKLLPRLLSALGERPGAAIDNLDRAERLGFIASADEWMAARRLPNQMVHEYVEDPLLLASALQSGHAYVPMLVAAAERMIAEVERRGWMQPDEE